MSLALFFVDEFNIIMGIKLFLKLGKPSKVIIPVAKCETCLILQQNHNSDVDLRKYLSECIIKANYYQISLVFSEVSPVIPNKDLLNRIIGPRS